MSNDETHSDAISRYVTVFQQLKDTETGEEGDRFVIHGEHHGDRCKLEDGDFVPIARPLAVIDVGTEITEDETTDWCNSHAGKAVLAPYFDGMEPDYPTLPDTEEYDVPA